MPLTKPEYGQKEAMLGRQNEILKFKKRKEAINGKNF